MPNDKRCIIRRTMQECTDVSEWRQDDRVSGQAFTESKASRMDYSCINCHLSPNLSLLSMFKRKSSITNGGLERMDCLQLYYHAFYVDSVLYIFHLFHMWCTCKFHSTGILCICNSFGILCTFNSCFVGISVSGYKC